jgi:hypothetical protein
MDVRTVCRRLALVLAVALGAPAVVQAGPICDAIERHCYPYPSGCYSPLHYNLPTVWKIYTCLTYRRPGPEQSNCPPGAQQSYRILKSRCPSIYPTAIYATPRPYAK